MEVSNPIVLVVIVVFFVGILTYVVISKIKRRGASWSGTVIDKNVSESATAPVNNPGRSGVMIGGNNVAVNRSYTIRIKKDSGEEFNWPVGEGFYQSVNVGDRLTKNPGTETPTKV